MSGLAILALGITAIVASRSLEASYLHGRLSAPPLYDDISYFLDAVRWTNAAKDQSIFVSLWDLLRQHAPFSSLVAIIGLGLFPGSFIGPYLVHAVVVLAFLLGIVWLIWRRPVLEIAAGLIAASCAPVLWHTVTEARPDLPSGLAIGLAASIKPTAFPAALALLGSAYAIRLLVDCIQAGGLRLSMRTAFDALLWFVLPLIAIVAVLIGPALVETVAYILNVFVGQRDLWTTGESFWAGLLRFSIGGEGQFGLHYWFAIGLILMLLRLVLAAIHGQGALLDAVVLLAAVLISYAIPSAAEIKTYYFGAMFYGLFVVAMVLNGCACLALGEALLDRFGDRHPPSSSHGWPGACAGVSRPAVRQARRHRPDQHGDTGEPAAAAGHKPCDRATLVALRDMKPEKPGPLYVAFSSPYPVTSATIQLYAERARMNLIVRNELYHRTAQATGDALLQSEILVLSSSIPHTLVGPRVGDELIARMDAEKGLCLLESQKFPDVTLRVYRRGC
ncbi:hypothetical protein WHZ77_33065 [Bradyrhizobium sp. A5]|uniref:hypothetical protein n=1 Tax=Bradyrhizobium sp. A5 TaxID=3133696 RepID=UPI0032499DD3